MEDQFVVLYENFDIIIVMFGWLVYVVVEMSLKLQSVEYVVFDEVDWFFEMGFVEQLQEIIVCFFGGYQMVLFFVMLFKLLVEFVWVGFMEFVFIWFDVDIKFNEQLKIFFFFVWEDIKVVVLFYLLYNVVWFQDQIVVFVVMKYYVEYFIELLMIQWVSCVYIYSVLDLIVCKINFVKFMFGKCFIFIVIDLVV